MSLQYPVHPHNWARLAFHHKDVRWVWFWQALDWAIHKHANRERHTRHIQNVLTKFLRCVPPSIGFVCEDLAQWDYSDLSQTTELVSTKLISVFYVFELIIAARRGGAVGGQLHLSLFFSAVKTYVSPVWHFLRGSSQPCRASRARLHMSLPFSRLLTSAGAA